jgi:hypothetical protein
MYRVLERSRASPAQLFGWELKLTSGRSTTSGVTSVAGTETISSHFAYMAVPGLGRGG